jgi:hypothetical protein
VGIQFYDLCEVPNFISNYFNPYQFWAWPGLIYCESKILTLKCFFLIQMIPNADFVKPRIQGSHGSKVFLPGRDDAAEFDDSAGTAELKGLVDDEVNLYYLE